MMLDGHIDLTFLHVCNTIQPTAIHTSYVIARYVLEIKFPPKWSYICICQIFDGFTLKMYTHMSYI